MSWGLVAGFARWMLGEAYAVGSINVCLSTVKVYADLARQADAIDASEAAQIRAVKGYAHREFSHIDE